MVVEITCIGCTFVRLHVESRDSWMGGATTIMNGSSKLDIGGSIVNLPGPLPCALFCAQISLGDSFFREAPSFISLWTDLRHNMSISLSPFRDFGDIVAPLVDSVHL
jgi:hypothetical protein